MDFGRARNLKMNGLLMLILFVAAVATTIAGTKRFVENKKDLESRADMYRYLAESRALSTRFAIIDSEAAAPYPDEATRTLHQERISYFRQMEQKYLRAAKEPWKPVPPDPPEPPRPPSWF